VPNLLAVCELEFEARRGVSLDLSELRFAGQHRLIEFRMVGERGALLLLCTGFVRGLLAQHEGPK